MTPEQAQEAQRTSALFQAALIAYGAQAVADSLALWGDIPPTPAVSTGQSATKWLAVAVRYVLQRRIRAQALALAYYRYQRALTTGTTIALPGVDNPPYVSLAELKREFETLLSAGPQAPASPSESPAPGTVEVAPTDDTQAVSEDVSEAPADSDRIPVEEMPGLHEELAALEEEYEKQVRDNLMNLGPKNQDKKISQIPLDDNVDEGRAKANKEAGNRQAANAARHVMNGARGPLYLVANKDKRAIGWVRVSRTGTPCGFCAMLISRQVAYRNERTAMLDESGDMYHDNCQCYAVPVFDMGQYESNPMFDLNRKYAVLWPKVTRGLSGDAAIAAWRRFIRQEAKSRKPLEAAA